MTARAAVAKLLPIPGINPTGSDPVASLLFDSIFSTGDMHTVFADAAWVQAMLAFERALAEAEAETGVIPQDAADSIAAACNAFVADLPMLAEAARQQATPAIPFVKALTMQCAEPGRGWVHWGATSQDAIDTALVLQMRDGVRVLDADIRGLAAELARLASEHRQTVAAGRTLLQPALPITFGFRCAGWLQAVAACRTALTAAAREALVLQFGGAVGTLAALGPAAEAVRDALGRRLDLIVPEMSWHTDRGRLVRLGAELAALCGVLAKIAGDIALMMQPELGEVSEPATAGRGGSSTMPHKHNPVAAPIVRANALRAAGLLSSLVSAMVQEHERGVGGWHAEWTTLPELFELAAGSLSHSRAAVALLEVDPARMRANMEIGGGAMMAEALMMALAPHLGRGNAHELVGSLVRQAREQGIQLAEAAHSHRQVRAHLDSEAIDRALEPANYLGLAGETVDRAIAHWNRVSGKGHNAEGGP